MSIHDKILNKIDCYTKWLNSWEKIQGISPEFRRGNGKRLNFSGYSWEVEKKRNQLANDIERLITKEAR